MLSVLLPITNFRMLNICYLYVIDINAIREVCSSNQSNSITFETHIFEGAIGP